MGVKRIYGRRRACRTLALAVLLSSTSVFAQTPTKQPPPPLPVDTTTVVQQMETWETEQPPRRARRRRAANPAADSGE